MTNTVIPINAMHAVASTNQFSASTPSEIRLTVAAEYKGWRTYWKGPWVTSLCLCFVRVVSEMLLPILLKTQYSTGNIARPITAPSHRSQVGNGSAAQVIQPGWNM